MHFSSADFIKLVLFCIGYLCFFFILSVAGVLVSAKSKTLKQSFIVLLSFWIIGGIVLPKTINTIAANTYKLPSNTAFKDAVRKDIANGIDGHNTNHIRVEKIKQDLLKKYGVNSTYKLPVNIEGVIMMEGEKYSSQVYNMHFDSLKTILEKQHHLLGYTSLINPFAAIRLLSMGACNSDMYNELQFRKAAEAYRMQFVQAMNEDMALHSKEDEFQQYKIGSTDFEKIAAFKYESNTGKNVVDNYLFELVSLFNLVIILSLLVFVFSKKIVTT